MSGYLSSFVTIHFIIFHRSTILYEEKNTSSYVDSSYLFFRDEFKRIGKTLAIESRPRRSFDSRTRNRKSVRVAENTQTFVANFLRITRYRRGKGAYGINFLRAYASPVVCAINSRHRNAGKVYSKRRRITPINYEAARGEGVGKKGGRRKCKFRGEERRRGFHSRLRRTNTSLENYFAAVEDEFCYCKQSKTKRIREVIEGEGKFTEFLNY